MASLKPSRRTQQARREETREALLNAAVHCICDLGYANTTIARVARRANVTPGAVQHHFGSRNDLMVAVIAAVGQLNFEMNVSMLRALSVSERIDAIIANYRSVYSSRLFRAALNIWLGVGGEPELYEQLERLISTLEDPVSETWRSAFEDVEVSPTALQSLRRLVMATVRGYTIQEIFDRTHRWEIDAALLRSMIESMLIPTA